MSDILSKALPLWLRIIADKERSTANADILYQSASRIEVLEGTETSLRQHIERIERELEEARANYAFMVDRAAQREPTLDGYRELGAKCAQLEQKLDEAQRSRDQYRNDALGCTARIAELEAENAKLRGQQSTSFTDEDECVWERDAARNP